MLSTIRHNTIFDPTKHDHGVTIVGAGATGSRVFAALVELGLKQITVIDPDTVEAHNLANQIFTHDDVGTSKVHALRNWASTKLGVPADQLPMEFVKARVPDDTLALDGVTFLLTDTMASRKAIADVFDGNSDTSLVIETRMAATHGNVFTFDPLNNYKTNAWRNTLTDDETTEVSACGGALSVGTTASIIANIAVWQLIHYYTNPAALEDQIDIYLQPLMITTKELVYEHAA